MTAPSTTLARVVDGAFAYMAYRAVSRDGRSAAIILDHAPIRPDGSEAAVVRKLAAFAERLDIARFWMVPLFARRTDHPWRLGQAADPVGPDCDGWIWRAVGSADIVIVAWGTPFALPPKPVMRERWRAAVAIVAASGRPVFSLGAPCGDGHPARAEDRALDTPLVPWIPPA